MTQPNLLEFAKQGDPQAIAALINQSLKSKGVSAAVTRQDNCLQVMLEAAQVPDQSPLVALIRQGMISLQVSSIDLVKIFGRKMGESSPAWSEEVSLQDAVSRTPSRTKKAVEVSSPPVSELPQLPIQPEGVKPPIPPASAESNFPNLANDPQPIAEPEGVVSEKVVVPEERLEPGGANPVVVSEAPRSPRFKQWQIGGAIAVLLIPLAAVGGYQLYSRNVQQEAVTEAPLVVPSPVSTPSPAPTPVPSPSPTSQTDPYEEAISRATSAVTFAQTAQSGDDWSLVAGRWQQAIDLLREVPASSPNYQVAQQKITEYQSNLAVAEQQAASRQQAAAAPQPPSTSTVTVSGRVSCPAVPSTEESQPVELTSVRFEQDETDAAEDAIVGCVTNHSDQPITGVSVAYRGSSEQNSELFQGGFSNLSFQNLGPGQTVPFRSSFTLNEGVSRVEISSIYWYPAGSTEAQEISTTLALTR